MIEYFRIVKDYVSVMDATKNAMPENDNQIIIDIIEERKDKIVARLNKLGILNQDNSKL